MLIAAAMIGPFLVLSLLLGLTEWAEQRLIGQPVLLARVAQSPKLTPEYAEAYVSRRAAALLGSNHA
jgi:hypothetical protein